MRITDNRYERDRERFDLALRMMGHGARSCTIWSWTGLSADRQRKLYRSYFQSRTSGPMRRRRGKAPQQPSFFLHTAELAFEASALAGMFLIQGLLDAAEPISENRLPIITVDRAAVLCATYEEHSLRYPEPQISLEYAWFLLKLLREGQHLKLGTCRECGRLYITEIVRLNDQSCRCGLKSAKAPRRGHLPRPLIRAIEACERAASD